jgi:putative transcriptional regulator
VIEVRLIQLLQKRGRSQYWLAKETSLSQLTIANLCKGKTKGIDFKTLGKICEALDCETSEFLVVSKLETTEIEKNKSFLED